MYSDLTLYYLNQIGIRPWISKEHHSALVLPKSFEEHKTAKLVILTPMHEGKTESLLRKILHSLELNDENFEVLQINDLSLNWLEERRPSAILSLGVTLPDFTPAGPFNATVIASFSLDHLIEKPLDKKKVFHDLFLLKQHLYQQS